MRMAALEESSVRESLTSGKPHSRKRQKSSRSSPNSDSSAPAAESVDVNCLSASRILLTKDLRHKRVFSPAVNSEFEEENEEQSKLLKGFVSSAAPDFDVKEYKLGKSRFARSEVGDERIDGANDLKLEDRTIPLPNVKMAPNGCQRKKVFKTPNSFSYRRLLPHLMDIVNNTSSVSKFELVDAGSPSSFRELDGVSFEPRSIAENSCAIETECVASEFDNDARETPAKVSNIQLDLSGEGNEPDRTAEITGLQKEKENGHQNNMNGVDGASVEGCIQTTPPDPGTLANTEAGRGRESADAKTNQTFIGLSVSREKGSSAASKQCPDTKCDAKLMNKMALNPCSRLRLFGNHPRSVSYRRLLPFLMDISKADSCTTAKPPKRLPRVVSEEDKHPAPAATAEHYFVNNAPKGKIYKILYAEDRIQTASDGSSPCSNSNLVSSKLELSATNYSSNIDPRSVHSESLPDLGMVNEENSRSKSGRAKLQLDLGSKETTSVAEPSSVVSYIQTKQCTFEEAKLVEKQNMCLSVGLEHNNHNTGSSEIVNLKQHSSHINKLDHLDALVSPNRPFKGILKRNRRGCRGLCNCLNCASFRLHAERAFEFSRNQLQDAEEVASQLMNELANVRLLLEKSIIEKDDSASIRPCPVLIKEACDRAIEAEILAKAHLGELNKDLSVHCRIPDLLQPKVSFAHSNQYREI
ncbi:uncharacterized protein LOC125202060 [Salvia hispanica]|uniref:uncharacterized protein LOC125202060 n=1 Tax=Salvia hispanica TaxID=49212 RepID=UPI002009A7E8|nr:uncharacterized protein LOC125202060 [Salvia hispanica]